MTRYTKLDPKNPAAGIGFHKTRHGQEKDRIRADLDAVLLRLGIKFSATTTTLLDKRLGSRGLGEMLTELTALEERIQKAIAEALASSPKSK